MEEPDEKHALLVRAHRLLDLALPCDVNARLSVSDVAAAVLDLIDGKSQEGLPSAIRRAVSVGGVRLRRVNWCLGSMNELASNQIEEMSHELRRAICA